MTADRSVPSRIRSVLGLTVVMCCWLVAAASAGHNMPKSLKPAYRITCRSDQPDIRTLFCATVNRTWPVSEMLVKACSEKTIFPQLDLNNSFVLMSLGTDLNIEIFILRCPCYDPRAGRPCPDVDLSRQNFTCAYYYFSAAKGNMTHATYQANVSAVNVTAPTCCRPGCGGGEWEEFQHRNGSDKGHRQPLDGTKPAQSADVGLVPLIVLSVAVVVLALLCVYFWRSRKNQRLDLGEAHVRELHALNES